MLEVIQRQAEAQHDSMVSCNASEQALLGKLSHMIFHMNFFIICSAPPLPTDMTTLFFRAAKNGQKVHAHSFHRKIISFGQTGPGIWPDNAVALVISSLLLVACWDYSFFSTFSSTLFSLGNALSFLLFSSAPSPFSHIASSFAPSSFASPSFASLSPPS